MTATMIGGSGLPSVHLNVAIAPLAARWNGDSLALRSVGAVGQYPCDCLESAHVAKPREDERDVSSNMPVVLRQPVDE
jgi:hypothetical protein